MIDDGTDDTLAANTLDAQPPTAPPKKGPRLGRGALVGRHVVLGTLGAGGMGVVYAAHDPELDRKVALKMLLPREGADDQEARSRLVREAQALAKLSHPNVVTVHDVGEHEGQVWIGMEFVEGPTLRHWMTSARRSWRDVLGVMLRAARGLQAAHAAGLLHRDFKPDNVMVGDDGRVRVMDLGLARAVSSGDGGDASERGPSSGVDHLEGPLTATGAIMGTPNYMAPEQLRGEVVDARADQFAFCVTLWEALHGQRPFAGDGLAELCANVLEGRMRPAPAGSRVPRWLDRVCTRGLATDREQRFPTMEALLRALESGQRRRRNRWLFAGLSCVPLLAGAAIGGSRLDEARRVAACEAEGRSIDAVWNADTRERLEQGLLATGATHAATTVDKVMPWLDELAAKWAEQQTTACLRTKVEESWSDETYARASWCLEERRMVLDALIAGFTDADARSVNRAVAAAAAFHATSPCLDLAVLERSPVPPEQVRSQIIAVRGDLARAQALDAKGDFEAALALVTTAKEESEALAWGPLHAHVLQRHGTLLSNLGRHGEAEPVLEAAFLEGARWQVWEVAADACARLADSVGFRQRRPVEGERWSAIGEVAVTLAGDPLGLREATRLYNLALVKQGAGDYVSARDLHARALALREAALPPNHTFIASSATALASAHFQLGSHEQAKELYARALRIKQEVLGGDHPDVASSLQGLASVEYAMGDHVAAERDYRAAIDILEKAYGPDHPDVAAVTSNLGALLFTSGQLDEAEASYERARGIIEAAHGAEHPLVASSLHNLALVYLERRDFERAQVAFDRALALKETTLGAEHPDLASTLVGLASLHDATGSPARAIPLQKRALAIYERLGPEHPDVPPTLQQLGSLHAAIGEHGPALAACERALAIFEKTPEMQEKEPDALLCVAQELAATRGDLGRALALAKRAQGGFESLGEAGEPGSTAVKHFIAQQERAG